MKEAASMHSRAGLLSATLALGLILGGAAGSYAQSPAPQEALTLNEAVRLTLENDPNLRLQEARLRAARGTLLIARGPFDPVLNSGLSETEANDPLTESTVREQSLTGTTLGVRKRFRNGFGLEPNLELLRTDGKGPGAVNVGTFSLVLRQPLLRGRGRTAVAAPELSAEREVAAGFLDLRQVTSERVLTVATQYWLTRAALLNLDILMETEDRARELLDTTRKLIDADVTPAAELVQVEANLAAKEAARIGGERDLFEARQSLGREIGLDRRGIAGLPLPSDGFPDLPAAAVPGVRDEDLFVNEALERRADLQATRERRAAAEILRRAGEVNLAPQLDLVATPKYTGLVEGSGPDNYIGPLFRNVPGAGATVTLNFAWPTFNSQARGELVRLEASREQSALVEELVARQIAADVPVALDAVARLAQQLERATEAVRLFERAVVNEEKKLRAGTSTLIDLINQRDRLTSARQSEVSTRLSLAVALLRLRFETGTLVPEAGPGGAEIEPGRFTTVPFLEETTP